MFSGFSLLVLWLHYVKTLHHCYLFLLDLHVSRKTMLNSLKEKLYFIFKFWLIFFKYTHISLIVLWELCPLYFDQFNPPNFSQVHYLSLFT